MSFLSNIDLFIVGVSTAGIAILGFLIFFNNKKSITNRAFLLLSIAAILYNGFNYITYKFVDPDVALFFLRLTIFFAVFYALSVFHLLYVFPETNIKRIPNFYKFFIIPIVILTSILIFTPFVFKEVTKYTGGRISNVSYGIGILLFVLVSIGLNFFGIIIFLKKMLAVGSSKRRQFIYVIIGVFSTVTLLIIFNLILPVFFDNSRFVTWGAAFILPFVAFTAYALIKYKLMNIKVVSAEILVFVIVVALFFEVLASSSLWYVVYRVVVFILVLAFGIFLIKSVSKE